MMADTKKLEIFAHGDRELVMRRSFDAPREKVFAAYTKPELIRQWLLGPEGWTMPVCEVDLRVGGKYRYVWQKGETRMGMGGEYREVKAPERIVATEVFDEAWYPGEAVGTLELVEKDGRTTVTQTMQYDSRATRDMVLKSPMESGVSVSYDRLEKMLAAQGTRA